MFLLQDKRYYVYVYLDPRKTGEYKYGQYEFEYQPFYVGMSRKKGRLYQHLIDAKNYKYENNEKLNAHKCLKILNIIEQTKSDPIIYKYKQHMNFKDCQQLQIKLITTIGRINLETGPLTNMIDGGNGCINLSKQARNSIRIKNKQKYKDPQFIKKMNKIRKKTIYDKPQVKQKIRQRNKKRFQDPQVRKQTGIISKKVYEQRPQIKQILRQKAIQQFKDPQQRRIASQNSKRINITEQYQKKWKASRNNKTLQQKRLISKRCSQSHKLYFKNNPQRKQKASLAAKKGYITMMKRKNAKSLINCINQIILKKEGNNERN